MIYINKNYIENIRKKINLVDVVSKFMHIQKIGVNYIALCPFHKEDTPSFYINTEQQYYYCFGCQISGDIFEFIKKYKSVTFINSVKYILDKYRHIKQKTTIWSKPKDKSVNLELIINHRKKHYCIQMPVLYNVIYGKILYLLKQTNAFFQKNMTNTAFCYLVSRKISFQIAERFNIGFSPNQYNNLTQYFKFLPNSMNLLYQAGLAIKKRVGGEYKFCDLFYARIIFPIKNKNGLVLGFGGRSINKNMRKYINSKETFFFKKKKILYGFYESSQLNNHFDRIILVEGYIDVIMLHQHNITNVVSLMGTSLTIIQLNLLFSYTNEVILCLDNDFAGYNAIQKIIQMYYLIKNPKKIIRILKLPKTLDPDSYIRKCGKKNFINKLKYSFYLIKNKK